MVCGKPGATAPFCRGNPTLWRFFAPCRRVSPSFFSTAVDRSLREVRSFRRRQPAARSPSFRLRTRYAICGNRHVRPARVKTRRKDAGGFEERRLSPEYARGMRIHAAGFTSRQSTPTTVRPARSSDSRPRHGQGQEKGGTGCCCLSAPPCSETYRCPNPGWRAKPGSVGRCERGPGGRSWLGSRGFPSGKASTRGGP